MKIDELYYFEGISNRSYNVCKNNDLDDLIEILKYYRDNGNFESLKNCGKKSNQELINLCLKNLEKTPEESIFLSELDKEKLNNILINQFNLLSNRCKNSLENYLKGKIEIENIIKKIIYNNNFNIFKLRNIGNKSYYEIECFLNNIREIIEENITDFSKSINTDNYDLNNYFSYIIKNLNSSQIEIINYFIIDNFKNLTNKSKNALSIFLNETIEIYNLTDKILSKSNFNYQNIKNVGVSAASELKDFILLIKDFIKEVSLITNEDELNILRSRFLILNTFSISSIPNEILKNESIFKLVDFLISKNVIFKKNENLIFQKAFNIYVNQTKVSLEEIANELKISRERVRQIKENILLELKASFGFLKKIKYDFFKSYNLNENLNFIVVDNNLNKLINQNNNTNFSIEFNSFIIYSFISDKYEFIGEIEDILLPISYNLNKRHKWNNIYIIKKDINKLFSFKSLVNNINYIINTKNHETYSYNLNSYLNYKDDSMVSIVFPIAKRIIYQEFKLKSDINYDVIFKKNVLKNVPQYAIEALEKLGVPSKIEEIYKLIELENPEITKSQKALRGSLVKAQEIIHFGRSSTYGLKKWEIEKEGIKGGTIKDIIIDFLKDKKLPIHISIILKHLKKFRGNRDERSVITNVKVDPDERFIVFNQSFIGLRINVKYYSEKYNKLPVQLGKTIIAMHQKGFTKSEINNFLQTNFEMTFDESNLVINNLNYFNEIKLK